MAENLELRGDTYYFRGQINGRLYRRSTGFKDLQRARRRASEIEGQIREGLCGWVKPVVPAFGSWSVTFLSAYHAGRVTEKGLLQRAIRKWRDTLLSDIHHSECRRYLSEREAEGAKKGTLERERVLLKQLFEAAVLDGKLKSNPFKGIKGYRIDARTRVMAEAEEMQIRALVSESWARYLTVALGTGLRSGEHRMLRPCDVKDGWIQVRPESNKLRKGRSVPVTKAVQTALDEQRGAHAGDSDAPYWPIKRGTARMMLKRVCEQLEFRQPITVHDLRRTFATRCALAGMWPKHLQMILGHQKIETTMRHYCHLDQVSVKDAMLKAFSE